MGKVDLLHLAWKNLMRRKARTFLTVLGVMIGVTAIIVMISLGLGVTESYKQMIQQWGSLNEIEVSQGWSSGDDTPIVLNDEKLEEIKTYEGVVAVAPQVQIGVNGQLGNKEGWLNIIGVDPETIDLFQYQIGAGRLLKENDTMKVILGSGVSDSFYDPNDPHYWDNYEYDPEVIYQNTLNMLGQKIDAAINNYDGTKTKKLKLEVVGVLDKESAGRNWYTYMPLADVQRYMDFTLSPEQKKERKKNGVSYDQVVVLTEDVNYSMTIAQTLRDEGYYTYTIAEELEGLESQSKTYQAILGGIGGITLLVAAIGIVNTMIMSIYERTKEIGIMKVMGATFGDIRLLFLAEAGLIGLIGGIFGIVLSLGLSYGINILGAGYLGEEGLSISIIPIWLVGFAVAFSILIGVISGLYPANRAVKLSPIEAIRTNS